jgi:hypothetical protein
MRHALIMLALAAAPAIAMAQGASASETAAVGRIAECLAQGAPGDSQRLTMVIELAKPLDETGEVRYFATGPTGEPRAYTPCDTRKPALILLETRGAQPPERRGWISARLVILGDGKFSLHYDYPK